MKGVNPISTCRCAVGFIVLLLALGGCSDPNSALPKVTIYQVTGRVVLKDGQPLTRGRVTLVPLEAPALYATGPIESDGRFSLTSLKANDGAVPGPYKVRIEPDPDEVAGLKGMKKLKYPFKYTDEDFSGIRVTIKPEKNELETIQLK